MNFKIICTSRNDYEIPYSCKVFSGGEVQVRLLKLPVGFSSGIAEVEIDGLIKNSDMLMEVAMLCDSLHRHGSTSITLNMHYLPYARQDRACTHGESFALSQFIRTLKSFPVDMILIDDAHSSVAADLLEVNGINYGENKQHVILEKYLSKDLDDAVDILLVSPDKGARKKAKNLAWYTRQKLIQYDKVRNPDTGAIERTELREESTSQDVISGRDCLIVDDICDYGGTFIPIAKDLKERGAKSVGLCVTHLVLPVDTSRIIESGIDRIFYVNKFNDNLDEEDKVFHISKIFNFNKGENK